MVNSLVKVTVTGAAGQIGYALVYRIASGQMLGPNTPIELRLLELERSLPALNGVSMELEDCAFPLLKNVVCTSDLQQAMQDTNWVICVGAVPRKAGMERADLLEINGGVFSRQGKAINDNAASDVRVLVVGNPCNTNALIAMNNAPDVPRDRFYAMTMLDELRAKAQLANKSQNDITAVTNFTIWGNHSATQYPDFYNAKINNEPAIAAIQDENWLQTDFVECVQKRGAEIIKARGASSAASAANAIISTVNHLVTDTAKGDTFSVCRCSKGEYGVDDGLVFSFPCRTVNGKLEVVTDISHNEFGQNKIKTTLDELKQERDTVKRLGFI